MEMEKTIETGQGIFHIRPYQDKDEDKVIQLWEAAFKSKIDRKTWKWKFHDNPFGKQMMLCFNDEGFPIAMFGGIPFPANWNSMDIKMTQLIDNMSHPNYRQATSGRKGLFIQNVEHFTDVYGGLHASVLLYGFPGKKHFRLGKLFLQYSEVGNGGAYLVVKIKKLKISYLPTFGTVDNLTAATDDFDKLWEAAKPHYPFSIKRNSQFIQWRFFEHPVHKYKVYTYKNMRGKMLAYAVVSVKENMATIVDIFAMPHKIAIKALIKKIKQELLSKGISKVQLWLPKKHFITDNLVELGFEEKPEPLGITPTGRSFDKTLDIDFAINNIYYTMGDGDLF